MIPAPATQLQRALPEQIHNIVAARMTKKVRRAVMDGTFYGTESCLSRVKDTLSKRASAII